VYDKTEENILKEILLRCFLNNINNEGGYYGYIFL